MSAIPFPFDDDEGVIDGPDGPVVNLGLDPKTDRELIALSRLHDILSETSAMRAQAADPALDDVCRAEARGWIKAAHAIFSVVDDLPDGAL
ncbi:MULTISPECIES: hypothetical protein [Protofrankia]|uniref:Uncharacterized protein n=1 Tax=Protofrankia coriariae TaxID=1562887 RepID=A0ABR5F561_9ACTN|nr:MULTISPECIES: hypothetical protein [Protofrankia]KLL11866.1 hypothetical protein FrCorBMG51_08580 [Protofrankia coriariae]ONH34248.1 hypothetical protein BL254_17155 [Protofrankia sp. BMG5.30]